MVRDVVPELLSGIQSAFEEAIAKNPTLKELVTALREGKVTHLQSQAYAIELGELLAKILGKSIGTDRLPDGRMYYNIAERVLGSTLGRNHELISQYAVAVQQRLNRQAGLGLAVQVPEFDRDRLMGLVNRLDSAGDFERVSWLLEEPIVNFSQSVVDEVIKVNAEFHAGAGLSPKIVRQSAGNCCDWCAALVGSYDYPDVPKDVYRRHRFCRCTVDYVPRKGRRQNVWTKKESDEARSRLERRKQMNLDVRDNNLKADAEEYKQIVEVLGHEHAPISLAKFQDLKYNGGEGYEQLKDSVHIRQKIKFGEWGTILNKDKQAPHNELTRLEGKSYFFQSVDPQKLFDDYHGTGRLEKDRLGRPTNVEYIVIDSEIGVAVSRNGQRTTNEFKIHHSKNRTHLSPVKKGGIE